MANTIAPFGFRTFGHRDGMAVTGGLERRFIASSDTNTYFTGDVVQQSSTILGFISSGSNTVPVAGIFAGCEYYNSQVGRTVWSAYYPGSVGSNAANGPTIAYIISDPEMQFIAQASSGSVVGTSCIGFGIGFTLTSSAGNTANGISAVALGSSTVVGSTGTLAPFRVIDVYSNFAPPGVNGTDNTTAGAILVVAPNNWDRKSLVGLST